MKRARLYLFLVAFLFSGAISSLAGPGYDVHYWLEWTPQERGGHAYYQLTGHRLAVEGVSGEHGDIVQVRYKFRLVSSDGSLSDWNINVLNLWYPDDVKTTDWTHDVVFLGVRHYYDDENTWYNEEGVVTSYVEGDTEGGPPVPDDYGTVNIYSVYVWSQSEGAYVLEFGVEDGHLPASHIINRLTSLEVVSSMMSYDPVTGDLVRDYYDADGNRVAIGVSESMGGSSWLNRLVSPYDNDVFWNFDDGDAPAHFYDSVDPVIDPHPLGDPDSFDFWNEINNLTFSHEYYDMGGGTVSTLAFLDTDQGREYYRVDRHSDGTVDVYTPSGGDWKSSDSGPGAIWDGSVFDVHEISVHDSEGTEWALIPGAESGISPGVVESHAVESDRMNGLVSGSTGSVDYALISDAVASGVSRADVAANVRQGLDSSRAASDLSIIADSLTFSAGDVSSEPPLRSMEILGFDLASSEDVSGVGGAVDGAVSSADYDQGGGYFESVLGRLGVWSDPFTGMGKQSLVSIDLGDSVIGATVGMPESIDIDLSQWPIHIFRALELIALGVVMTFTVFRVYRGTF